MRYFCKDCIRLFDNPIIAPITYIESEDLVNEIVIEDYYLECPYCEGIKVEDRGNRRKGVVGA